MATDLGSTSTTGVNSSSALLKVMSNFNVVADFFAFSNNYLTLLAPIPANNSTNSEPLIEKNGTLA